MKQLTILIVIVVNLHFYLSLLFPHAAPFLYIHIELINIILAPVTVSTFWPQFANAQNFNSIRTKIKRKNMASKTERSQKTRMMKPLTDVKKRPVIQ